MALSYGNNYKTGGLDGALASLNLGSGQQSAFNVYQSTTLLAGMPFTQSGAFTGSTILGGNAVANAAAISASSTPTPGTIDNGKFVDKSGVSQVAFTMSLSGGGGDMTVGAVVIPSNATSVTCSGVTVTMVFS